MAGPSRWNRKTKARNDARKGASRGGRTASERGLGRSMAAAGRTVSASNLRGPKTKPVRAVRQPRVPDPLRLPEVQSTIERLRTKYGASGRTLSQESLGENLAVGRERDRAERKLENAALRSLPTRGEALKAAPEVRAATQLNAEGTRVERLAGARQVGNEGLGAVQRAADRGRIKREGDRFTTPRVRRVRRKVRRAKRRVGRARAAAQRSGRINIPGGEGVFINRLARETGLNPRVVAAWTKAEGGNSFGDYNLLNIGHTGSGPNSAAANGNFADPVSAAKATAAFLRGEWGGAEAGIPNIISQARGKDPATQIRVIEQSGWRLGKTGPDPKYSNLITSVFNEQPGVTRANPRAKRRLERAEARAENVAKEASDLGIDSQNLVTPQVARQLGIKPPEESGAPPKAVKSFRGMIAAAKQLEAWQLPYVWGGGHGTSKVGDPRQYGGLDCSSTVSHILQQGGVNIPTIVSGSFGEYTKPGPGAVTILYNPGHVLMKIGNKYFGTSGTNPGGGPGWLDKSLGDSEMASGKYNIGHIPGLGPKIAKQMNLDPDSYRVFPGMSVDGNTATADTGTVSYTPTFSDSPIVAGDGPTSREQRRKSVLRQLRDLGFNVTPSGVRRTGLAAGSTIEAPESVSKVKERYGIK